MLLQNIVNSLDFKENGQSFTASPTQYFWQLWKYNKDELKRERISVYKDGDEFIVKIPDILYDRYKVKTFELNKVTNLPFLKRTEFLKDYQITHARYLLNSALMNGNILDGSETGIGKTYCALAVANELERPVFIITPKTVIRGWSNAIVYTGVKCNGIINYEALKFGNTEYLTVTEDIKVNKQGKTLKKVTYKWNLPKDTIIIWDEVHRCRNHKSINAAMLDACVEQGYRCFGLSATVADNPQHLGSIGPMLKIFKKEHYFSWMLDHGVFFQDMKGRKILSFSGAPFHLYQIHKDIYPTRGHRVTKNELGDLFPENLIVAESYEMDNAEKINRIIKKMQKELRNLQRKKNQDVNQEHPLTIRLRARQEIELLKVPTFVELAEDAIEEGNSVIIFVNYRESLEALKSRLKTDCAIYGGQKEVERDTCKDAFNTDQSRVIIVNIQAGGVGIDLHDTIGNHPRYVIVSPTDRSLDLVQALGRAHRSGGVTKVLQKIIFAAGTIEEDVCEKVNLKINNLNAINDGDLSLDSD